MTPNGIYGVKLHAHQHDRIARTLRWTKALPDLRFVYLERRDLLGQAISLVRAEQTGQWRATYQKKGEPLYSGEWLRKGLSALVQERARWSVFFARNGIHIVYEEFVSEPESAIERIAALVEVKLPTVAVSKAVDRKIQRDNITEEWRRRFIAEHANPDFIDPISNG